MTLHSVAWFEQSDNDESPMRGLLLHKDDISTCQIVVEPLHLEAAQTILHARKILFKSQRTEQGAVLLQFRLAAGDPFKSARAMQVLVDAITNAAGYKHSYPLFTLHGDTTIAVDQTLTHVRINGRNGLPKGLARAIRLCPECMGDWSSIVVNGGAVRKPPKSETKAGGSTEERVQQKGKVITVETRGVNRYILMQAVEHIATHLM